MMKCPSCGNDIQVSMQDILNAGAIVCPSCGLRIEIDKPKSDKAKDAVEKLKEESKQE